MYYLMMKTAIKPDFNSKSFLVSKNHSHMRLKEISLVDFKYYQKLFVVLISLSTILISPEFPREMENICKAYNSRTICNVW